MRTRKGIKGIRKFLAETAHREGGWQVFVDDEYIGFMPFTANKVYAVLNKAIGGDKLMLSDVIGNGLWFSAKES